MTYMVVDDSRMARKMVLRAMKKYIDEDKDSIIQAYDGAEAVALYREYEPDFVFMDLTMPVMDGFEALEQIRKFDNKARVIILSADIQQGAVEKVLANGALQFIKKPIDASKIEEIFEHYIHQEA